MAETLDRLKAQVLSMPEDDRVDLLNALVDSIHEDRGLSEAWMEEIRRRQAQIASGEVELLDEDEMFAEIEARRG